VQSASLPHVLNCEEFNGQVSADMTAQKHETVLTAWNIAKQSCHPVQTCSQHFSVQIIPSLSYTCYSVLAKRTCLMHCWNVCFASNWCRRSVKRNQMRLLSAATLTGISHTRQWMDNSQAILQDAKKSSTNWWSASSTSIYVVNRTTSSAVNQRRWHQQSIITYTDTRLSFNPL